MKYQHLQTIIKKDYGVAHSLYTFGNSMKYITTLLLATIFSLTSFGQSDTLSIVVDDSLLSTKTIDSSLLLTNVNVFKDPRLDVLKKRSKLVTRSGKTYASVRASAKEEIIKKRKERLGVSGASNLKNGAAIKRGKKRVTGSIVTRKGYRVNIYSGSNRSAALNAKRKFMRSYGGTPSYMSYISPYFKIRVGNYASKKSAYRMLRKLQAAGFPKSFVVPDIVRIKNINVR